MTERVLNWAPKFDERSKKYPVRGILAKILPSTKRNKLWRVGPILDQGYEGACVGFGWAAEALSTPVAVDLNRVKADIPREPNRFARYLYSEAKKIDEWDGEDYDGTSVLAGAKAMTNIGLVKEYRWAFSINDVLYAVIRRGPVVIGIWWHESMYEAPNGVLDVSGEIVGGHCLTVVGFRPKSPKCGGEDAFILQNSWGPEWGINGLAEIRSSDLEKLLANEGEACVAYRRSFGR